MVELFDYKNGVVGGDRKTRKNTFHEEEFAVFEAADLAVSVVAPSQSISFDKKSLISLSKCQKNGEFADQNHNILEKKQAKENHPTVMVTN